MKKQVEQLPKEIENRHNNVEATIYQLAYHIYENTKPSTEQDMGNIKEFMGELCPDYKIFSRREQKKTPKRCQYFTFWYFYEHYQFFDNVNPIRIQ